MSTDFRTELFHICKLLHLKEESKKIVRAIRDMSIVHANDNADRHSHSANDLAYLAKRTNSEFYGFLFWDDGIETIELPNPFKPQHLSKEERELFERGHKTIVHFINMCLADIAREYPSVADIINPYSQKKEIGIDANVTPILTDEELDSAVKSFKEGNAYKTFLDKGYIKLLQSIDINSRLAMMEALKRSIIQSIEGDVSRDLRNFADKLRYKIDDIEEVILAGGLLLLSLRFSLELASRSMYRAACGEDLLVLNNDNIINIEKRKKNLVFNYIKVFSTDAYIALSGGDIGSILLIDCDLPNKTHIHEFGMLTARTLNLTGEFGTSAKYSFVSINEEMSPIYNLVDCIVKSNIPTIIFTED